MTPNASLVATRHVSCHWCNLSNIPGQWSFGAAHTLSKLLRLGCDCDTHEHALLVDVGTSDNAVDAYSFLHRLPSASQFRKSPKHPNWRVASFEPLPSNCAVVQQRLARFGNRSLFVCKALSDEPHERATLMLSPGSSQESVLLASTGRRGGGTEDQSGRSITVEVSTLDLELEREREVMFLKMDAQGSELHILRGADRLLSSGGISWLYTEFDPAALAGQATRARDSSAKRLLELLRAYNFSCVDVREKMNPRFLAYNISGREHFYTDIVCAHARVGAAPPWWEQQLLASKVCHPPSFAGDDVCGSAQRLTRKKHK